LGGEEEGVIASFLAQYLAVVFYSEMEEHVGAKVRDHITRCSGTGIGLFIHSNMAGMIKRTPKSDIGKLVAQFGEDFKSEFEEKIDDRSVTRYSNVIASRHAIGHRQGSNITLKEVGQGIEAANQILDALQGCFEADSARAAAGTAAASTGSETGSERARAIVDTAPAISAARVAPALDVGGSLAEAEVSSPNLRLAMDPTVSGQLQADYSEALTPQKPPPLLRKLRLRLAYLRWGTPK
jgi:hypothetical protein